MCSDDKDNVNNALHKAAEPTATLCVQYGAYKNWGRWNHNPRRVQPLIKYLNDKNFSVQLKHDTAEGDDSDHGYVCIKHGDVELARDGKIQHNRSWGPWSDLEKNLTALADKALEKYNKSGNTRKSSLGNI